MAEFSKLVVTRKGQALIAKILAGTATDIDFVSVAASDASYSVDELEGLESLSAIMQESEISRKTRTNEVAVKVETAFSNTDLTVGYHMRTLGLFANDPDEGKILYAATVETSGNCYMPPYNGITVSGAYIQLITTVGNADNVSLEVNPGAIATIGDIQYLQTQINDIKIFIGLDEGGAGGHMTAAVTDETGVHGLRYKNDELQIETTDESGKKKWQAAGGGASAVNAHNEDEEAHADIRLAVKNAQDAADKAVEAISKIAYTVDVVPTQNGSLTYTGGVLTPVWNSFNPATLKISGQTSGTDAGTYNAIFTLEEGYTWSDGTKDPKTVQWVINRATISVPTQSNSLIYNGQAQTVELNGYDSSKMTLGGTTTGTNAGTYPASVTPGANFQWPDGSTAAKTVNWSIGRAVGSLTLSKSSLALNAAKLSDTFTATRAGGGAISATSSNPSVATVSVSGNVITVTGKAKGSATITVKVAADTNYNAPGDKTCSVTVTMPTSTFNDNTWATIKEASDAGTGANYWAVGDEKTLTLNGNVQGYTFNNLSIKAFILGFNHNATREGGNRIHFQIGKIGSAAVALCDAGYNNYYGNNANSKFVMNTTNTNSGGWNGSHMRKTVLGNSGTPTSPPANSLLAALPADLRAVMKSTTKYTDNTGGGSDNASYVTATTDYLFLLAEFEVFGARSGANSAEQNYQKQYDYYKAGNSRVAYNHTAVTTAVWWWLRSPSCGASLTFRVVDADGGDADLYAYSSAGVRPGFSV